MRNTRNRNPAWGAVVMLCLCLIVGMGNASVDGGPVELASMPVATMFGAADTVTLEALPAALRAEGAVHQTSHGMPAVVDRQRRWDVSADTLTQVSTSYAIYLLPAASLRPRPGWRWSI